MDKKKFLNNYLNGQRLFTDIDFADSLDLSNHILNNIEFKRCCLFGASFNNTKLKNTKFTVCNLKCSNFKKADLTNAYFEENSCESMMFKDAIVTNMVFKNCYAYGGTFQQGDFDDWIKKEG